MNLTSGFLITLDRDLPPDLAEHTVELLRSIRGVTSVEPVAGDPVVASMAEQRTLARCRQAMLAAVHSLR